MTKLSRLTTCITLRHNLLTFPSENVCYYHSIISNISTGQNFTTTRIALQDLRLISKKGKTDERQN